ncbi:MAG: hypothetical protein A3B38_02910 [Candidatus Levybacteria bacterium RIFCSPLOWO2_01_FULL_36_13]|nr:MAG: hypothetical protein A2684_04000 [Candidatus Levybacteria bacterium RIFCSPHIGHO2_01_FULL_36_15b]OGH35843.1 MAG: hypothetical protein A3B38_02910 [Candidatus Levybacteria bacterium RIFCSPLOWO2_01_FULL_36_13]
MLQKGSFLLFMVENIELRITSKSMKRCDIGSTRDLTEGLRLEGYEYSHRNDFLEKVVPLKDSGIRINFSSLASNSDLLPSELREAIETANNSNYLSRNEPVEDDNTDRVRSGVRLEPVFARHR